ncbi:hypothetical protein PG984_013621 [Apiospora sp. TS-2023a]
MRTSQKTGCKFSCRLTSGSGCRAGSDLRSFAERAAVPSINRRRINAPSGRDGQSAVLFASSPAHLHYGTQGARNAATHIHLAPLSETDAVNARGLAFP